MDTETTVTAIRSKVVNGQPLTPWEQSTYRLNYRPSGERYSANRKTRDAQYDADIADEMRQRKARQ